jgi:hypothetical protein
VVALQADEPPPEEIHAGEDVADTRDAINAGKEVPSKLDEDAMHFAGDPASLSPAESFEEKLEAPADNAPPEELPSGERREIDAPPLVADDGIPCAAAEREPSGPSPEAKLMEVDPSAAVVETYSAADRRISCGATGARSRFNKRSHRYVFCQQAAFWVMPTSATDIHTTSVMAPCNHQGLSYLLCIKYIIHKTDLWSIGWKHYGAGIRITANNLFGILSLCLERFTTACEMGTLRHGSFPKQH